MELACLATFTTGRTNSDLARKYNSAFNHFFDLTIMRRLNCFDLHLFENFHQARNQWKIYCEACGAFCEACGAIFAKLAELFCCEISTFLKRE